MISAPLKKLGRVGWLVWNVKSPSQKEFSTQALTEADRKNGYACYPVYRIMP